MNKYEESFKRIKDGNLYDEDMFNISHLVNKAKPKLPDNIEYDECWIEYWNCPYCGGQHSAIDKYGKEDLYEYCPNCGQKIDWSK